MKICIDAGHTGRTNPYLADGETIGWESGMAWKLHNLLAEKLEAAGAEVIRTRSQLSENPALEDRGRMAKGCDLFLSLHSNAAGDAVTDYPLACCCVAGTADDIGLKLARTVASVMGTAQAPRIWKRDYQTGGGAMLQSDSEPSFGKAAYQKDYYGVLRGAAAVSVPGVLLECSFHTNPSRARWLTADANLETLAGALCDAIAAHYGLGTDAGSGGGGGSLEPDAGISGEGSKLDSSNPDASEPGAGITGGTAQWAARYAALKAEYDALLSELTALLSQHRKG